MESLDTGAVENWLVRAYLHAKKSDPNLDWTFYCMLARPGRLDEMVRAHGGKVLYARHGIGELFKSLQALRATLLAQRSNVLHCHHDFMSGFYLLAATGLPIGRRYVHVHNTDEALPTPSRLKHRLLLEPLRGICLHMADGVIGISEHVLTQFLRGSRPRPGRDRVLYYGVDLDKIRAVKMDRGQFRAEEGLPEEAKILLFIGRMAPIKNPCFVLDVLEALLPLEPQVYAVFAGTGDLEVEVRRRAAERDLSGRIRLLGWRNDGAWLMKNSDLFVFPRLEKPKEGLGLVVVESQACGLPVLTTPGICDDAVVNPQLVVRIPLSIGPQLWAEQASRLMGRGRAAEADVAEAVAASRFGMDESVRRLLELYDPARHSERRRNGSQRG